MSKLLYAILILVVSLMIPTSGSVKATPMPNVILISHLFNSGGGSSAGSAQQVKLIGVLGQVAIETAMSNNYYLSSGFYGLPPLSPTANEEGPEPQRSEEIFLPLINR